MTDPKQWIDDGAPDDVRQLLLSARAEQPGSEGMRRTLSALGVTGAVLSAAPAGAAGVAKASTTALSAIAVKWGLIGAVGAVVSYGTVEVVRSRADAPQSSPATAVVRPGGATPPARAASPARAAFAVAPVEPPVAAAAASPPAEQRVEAVSGGRRSPLPGEAALEPAADSTVALEVRAVDEARRALIAGDLRRVLGLTSAYSGRFAAPRFEPEMLYLRLEAQARSGDVVAERETARLLLARHPSAPQAARARAVLDDAR